MADPIPLQPPIPPQSTVFFPLTVESDLSLTAQSLLRRECGADITLEPLPDRHQARLWVYLTAAAYSVALHAVVLGLPGAEFGPVKIAPMKISPLKISQTAPDVSHFHAA